ncbi:MULTISPECIES: cation-transporting P-type ATPase [Clostridium]|uniref:Calcium-transporting ATPase 1 n=2 Tax=Clostridium TaxID=1485 RepID=D8GP09_CLOLD|nr:MULTISPECIES: cation-transporting P-type ATPase [Clostridium]ADK13855.1 predicted cation-transporting ATPase [Clostridium ljungdahlii DSM 13528]OAA87344.1 Calcium-transporting ATPase 1 [Clostridium ljungdahlii DSM 13528]RMC93192.1 cation-transporting P-type ATPase [Clostridium autoethanogenum]
MIEWYKRSWSEIVKELNSNTYYGLDEDQITPLREKYGKNHIVMPNSKGLFHLTMVQFKEIWVISLILFAAIFSYLGMFIQTFLSLLIVFLNIFAVALEQYKEERNFKELRKLNFGTARVIRDGRTMRIPFEELVVGDIVIVEQGQLVPADMRIIESNDLKIDECSVTGESFISEKYESKIDDNELTLSDMKNVLFKSSSVVSGDGTGIVIAVGMDTQVANMVKLLLKEEADRKSFGFRLNKIFNIFSEILIFGLLIAGGVSNYIFHHEIYYSLKRVANVYLLSLPQTFSVIILLMGIILFKNLEKKNINFKDLSSVEKLSEISTVCTDKVGAFSKNKMDIVKAYGSTGFIDISEESLEDGIHESLYRMMHIGLLCNDVKSINGNIENSREHLVEQALIKFCQQNGMDKKDLDKRHKRIFQILFDSERRIMTTVNRMDDKYRAHVKGAADSIIDRCTHMMKNGVEVEITEEDIKAIKDADISMANDCLYVVAFAYRNFNYEPSPKENIESNLVFVGLIGFDNMLKENAVNSIKKALSLSIKPIIITEDNKLTALSVGKKLNFVSRLSQIISGVEIDNMTEKEFERIGGKVSIFSMINSKHKVKIVKTLKSYGYITAITGWKLTDLPALKMSNVGITNTKSNIVKKLCDIFTENMDFMSIIDTIEDSRKIMHMIKKMILYIISCSTGFFAFLMISLLFDLNISNNMIVESLWFNSVLVFLSSLALMCQYKEEEGDYDTYTIDKDIIKENMSFIVFGGFLMGVLAFGVFYFASIQKNEFPLFTSISLLNTCAVLFVYSFSNEKFFNNIYSNAIVIINVIVQFIGILVLGNFKILFDINYWKIFLIGTAVWLIFCMVYKFSKNEYV